MPILARPSPGQKLSAEKFSVDQLMRLGGVPREATEKPELLASLSDAFRNPEILEGARNVVRLRQELGALRQREAEIQGLLIEFEPLIYGYPEEGEESLAPTVRDQTELYVVAEGITTLSIRLTAGVMVEFLYKASGVFISNKTKQDPNSFTGSDIWFAWGYQMDADAATQSGYCCSNVEAIKVYSPFRGEYSRLTFSAEQDGLVSLLLYAFENQEITNFGAG